MFVLSRNRTAWLLAVALATGSLASSLTTPVLANGYPPVDFYVTPTSGGEGDAACELDPETNCSLQEALNVSGSNGLHHDNIHLAAGSYTDGPYTYLGESSDPEVFLIGASHETTFVENISGGPAMYFATPGLVFIDEITFRNNADGGVFIEDVSGESAMFDAEIQDSSFIDNGDTGVRIYQDTHSGRAQIFNSTFSGNAGQRSGGGISILGSNGETSLSVAVENVTMTDNTTSIGEGEGSGAGAYIFNQGPDSPVTITRSTFTDNLAQRIGGGLSVVTAGVNSYVTIGGLGEGDGNTFTGNSTLYDNGGGFSVTTNGSDAPITVQGNTLKGNSSYWGGGFFLDTNGFGGDTSLTVTNNTIGGTETGEGNTSDIDGGGMYLWVGGGATIENNTMIGNTSGEAYIGGGGAGIYVDREELNESPVSFSHNIAEQNLAPSGGGVGILGVCNCAITIDGNRLSQNTSADRGAGLALRLNAMGGTTRVRNNIIDGNLLTSDGAGAGMNVIDSAAYGVDIVNNTITGNRLTVSDNMHAWGGAGLYFTGYGGEGSNDYTIANNLFWENSSASSLRNGGTDVLIESANWDEFFFTNNDITDVCRVTDEAETFCNQEEDVSNMDFTETSNNLFAKNPWFENADEGDYRLGSVSLVVGAASEEASSFPDEDFGGYDMNEPPDIAAFQLRTDDYPEVETGATISLHRSNATVEGTVLSTGESELGRTGVLVGEEAGDYSLSFASYGGVTVGEAFSATPSSLACNTEYHYVAFGQTDIGTGYGEDQTFVTESCRSGGGGAGRSASGTSAPSTPSVTFPSYTPIYNPTTGHLEAPGSKQAGPSPFNEETEWISLVSPGWYIRGEHYDTVYYVDQNLHRHPLWDAQTYFTWNESFDSIIWVTDATLQTLTMDTPLLYKPGVVLVKISDQPFVYAIGADGLRQIPDEATAISVHGADWADYVLDIPPTIFKHFTIGSPVTTGEIVDKTKMKKRAAIAAML